MNARLLALLLLCLPGFATAQGFAGLGTDAQGFAVPDPAHRLSFPADHGAHPEFRIEWWYLTATLTGEDGRDYGIQWTLFRSALAPYEAEGWASPQLWMAHAALTTPDRHFVAERRARGGIGQAGVSAEPFLAYLDDWEMRATAPGIVALSLSARGQDFSYALTLEAQGPLVLQGDQGYSVKSRDGHASHYYSQPAYDVTGTLTLPDGPVRVTGQGWLDREWSSQPLSGTQSGWDWFSLSFEGGEKMMGFRLRDTAGDFTAATWISPDGSAEALPEGALSVEPLTTSQVAGRGVPTRWRLDLPAKGLSVDVTALNPQAWMTTSFPYWEGPVTITGSHAGKGYLEMTGY
ncbi:lipocalin-like domain-containing protein [Seohaeicola zhoushanensis]|uniref:Iron ABC transporter permease n=1 Tax=Seohaeicola zhoushanensis TaxID=1569283 RepID=A0A8J3GY45_9RHOB|nr:lipocalin-like domain-containing protein [Seohaeicola zhoushanensis]GHF56363.1 iron ABC transporter permease [Seohaeicola zhoushanensis]